MIVSRRSIVGPSDAPKGQFPHGLRALWDWFFGKRD